MPEAKLPEVSFTWDTIIMVVAFVVAVSGVLVAIYKGYEVIKKVSLRDRVKKLEGEMGKVQERLKLGDKRFQLQSDDSGQILGIMQALLLHFITGNDHDKLKEQLLQTSNYMNQRATRQQAIENGGEQHD